MPIVDLPELSSEPEESERDPEQKSVWGHESEATLAALALMWGWKTDAYIFPEQDGVMH